jgi:hypothetical protein
MALYTGEALPFIPLNPDSLWDASSLWQRKQWHFSFNDKIITDFEQICETHEIDEQTANSYKKGEWFFPILEEFGNNIRKELLSGSGVAWIKGFPIHHIGEQKTRLLYSALGVELGKPLENYGRLYEVKDTGHSYKDRAIPVSQTNAETTFHTDSSAAHVIPDFVGLLCLQPAIEGGESLVVSATTVYKTMHLQYSHLLSYLHEEFIRDIITPGIEPNAQQLFNNRFPIFSYDEQMEELTFRYMRYWIETGYSKAGISLSPCYFEAFDCLDKLLSSAKNVVSFYLHPGDMLWVNNRTIAHNRTAYIDNPANPRRLLRMWVIQQ